MRHFFQAASRCGTSKAAARPMPGPRRQLSRWSGLWRKRLAMPLLAAVAAMAFATGTEAATFELKDGSSVQGEVVHATRNTLMVRLSTGGGLRQLSRHDLESVSVTTNTDGIIAGSLESWDDGVYELQAQGRMVKLKNGSVLAESDLEPPLLTIANAKDSEAASALVFELALSRPSKQPVLIIYGTIDRTAKAGEDYEESRGSITIRPGETATQIAVPLIDNDVAEEDKRFEVFVATDQNVATIKSKRAEGIIVNDDEEAALDEDSNPALSEGKSAVVEAGEEISLKETE